MWLSEDVIVEILSRLPVNSLLRFKSVCKSWNAIINDPMFVSKHHQTTSLKEYPQVVLISRRDDMTNNRVISLLRNDPHHTFMDQHLPTFLNDTFGHVRLIGPCNGIVCLFGFPDNIALWNPSTRDFKKLPQSQVQRPLNAKVRGGDLGVGFDSKTRDFKVMQILFCASTDCGLIHQVEIYSSSTNSWRKYEHVVPANIMYQNIWSMVYKNETFCWWAQDGNVGELILSFDMSKEAFQKTPLPSNIEGLGGQHRTTRAVMPLKESIALVVYRSKELSVIFDVWVVNGLGGDADSWSRVTSIGPLSRVERPLGFWNDDDIIFESNIGELVVYNRTNEEIKNLGVYGKRSRLEVLVYRESLFSVN
ncbi:putative F-box protein at3g17490 [Phtheirospermum japonicum]|uniref:Putative F-box protein at3g17490 n=1 Tax=Phtheirospermum japonicum TaxID=374723 RepID=A0A830C9Y2_9LAMI|nr:putative F-box protein at3g17490 [Phtheirospermum japonicum]